MEEIIHNYKIKRLYQVNDESGTVRRVDYEVETISGEYSSTVEDSVDLEVSNIENFIEYQNLTEETVLQWIKDVHGDKNELRNLRLIERKKNPPKPSMVVEDLPWN
jgi:hypothetical protein